MTLLSLFLCLLNKVLKVPTFKPSLWLFKIRTISKEKVMKGEIAFDLSTVNADGRSQMCKLYVACSFKQLGKIEGKKLHNSFPHFLHLFPLFFPLLYLILSVFFSLLHNNFSYFVDEKAYNSKRSMI